MTYTTWTIIRRSGISLLMLAFALWTALSHTRFLFFLGLIVAPLLAPYIHLFTRYDREQDKPWVFTLRDDSVGFKAVAGVFGYKRDVDLLKVT